MHARRVGTRLCIGWLFCALFACSGRDRAPDTGERPPPTVAVGQSGAARPPFETLVRGVRPEEAAKLQPNGTLLSLLRGPLDAVSANPAGVVDSSAKLHTAAVPRSSALQRECLASSDCGKTSVCTASRCVAGQRAPAPEMRHKPIQASGRCSQTGDCAGGAYCSTLTARCQSDCKRDPDCGG